MRRNRIMSMNAGSFVRAICLASLTAGLACLAGCHGNDKKSGQSLVRVNGDEITVHQLNEEFGHSAIPQNSGKSPDELRKQVLEALVDRQLLVGEATRNKLDRDLNVMQEMERAKAQILAQAYLRSRMEGMPKPSTSDVETYYRDHPEFFSQRKVFELKQLVIATTDFGSDLNAVMDNAKALDEVAAWLDVRKIEYAKMQSVRASSDFPPQILNKIQVTDKTQLFVVKDGGKSLLMSVAFLKDSPVSLQVAAPEIMQYLANKKNQEIAEAELKRLRSIAKLEYINQADSGAPDKNASTENDANRKQVAGTNAGTKGEAASTGMK